MSPGAGLTTTISLLAMEKTQQLGKNSAEICHLNTGYYSVLEDQTNWNGKCIHSIQSVHKAAHQLQQSPLIDFTFLCLAA